MLCMATSWGNTNGRNRSEKTEYNFLSFVWIWLRGKKNKKSPLTLMFGNNTEKIVNSRITKYKPL